MDVIADIHFQVISASPRAGGKPFMDDIEMTLIAKRTLAQYAAEVATQPSLSNGNIMKRLKPNLFQIGTKELAQDAVLTWFLQWADPAHAQTDPVLHKCAQALTRCLLGESDDFVIRSVQTWRQWKDIDVLAEINGNIALAIEGKTDSAEHSEQLDRYRAAMKDEYELRGFHCSYTYVKTGNESLNSLAGIDAKGWRIIGRPNLLHLLVTHPTENAIAQDFTSHLKNLEDMTQCFGQAQEWMKNGWAVEGFCLALQRQLGRNWDWGWVSNAAGGFMALYSTTWPHKVFREVYLQFELGDIAEPRLTIRAAGNDITTEMLYKQLEELQSFAIDRGLRLEKPSRFRAGGTSALAVLPDVWGAEGWQKIDWAHITQHLHETQNILSAWSSCPSKES